MRLERFRAPRERLVFAVAQTDDGHRRLNRSVDGHARHEGARDVLHDRRRGRAHPGVVEQQDDRGTERPIARFERRDFGEGADGDSAAVFLQLKIFLTKPRHRALVIVHDDGVELDEFGAEASGRPLAGESVTVRRVDQPRRERTRNIGSFRSRASTPRARRPTRLFEPALHLHRSIARAGETASWKRKSRERDQRRRGWRRRIVRSVGQDGGVRGARRTALPRCSALRERPASRVAARAAGSQARPSIPAETRRFATSGPCDRSSQSSSAPWRSPPRRQSRAVCAVRRSDVDHAARTVHRSSSPPVMPSTADPMVPRPPRASNFSTLNHYRP